MIECIIYWSINTVELSGQRLKLWQTFQLDGVSYMQYMSVQKCDEILLEKIDIILVHHL